MNLTRSLKGLSAERASEVEAQAVSRRKLLKQASVLGGAALFAAAANWTPHAFAQESAGTLTLDVAQDARTWRFDNPFPDGGDPLTVRRGATFIVQGNLYPEGTISGGLSGPDQAGAIGTWLCKGTFNHDFAEIMEGQVPHVTTTQYYVFEDGSTLVSEGYEGGAETVRAVLGGTGKYFGARGEVVEKEMEENDTLAAGVVPGSNITFVFKLV